MGRRLSSRSYKKLAFSLILTVIVLFQITSIVTTHCSSYEDESQIDFLWGYGFEGDASAPKLELTNYATEVIRKALGSAYSFSVYIEPVIKYDFSFGIHSPYQASLYLSEVEPRVEQVASGHISLEPRNLYFDFSSSSEISLIVGAEVFFHGVKIAGGKYYIEKDFSFNKRIYMEEQSPLGTYRLSIKKQIDDAIGKILPKIELILGLGIGAVVSVPLDWDLELIFESSVEVNPKSSQKISVSPSSITFNKEGSKPYSIIPNSGGQDSIKWDFSQKLSMGIDFYIEGKVTADLAAGVAVSYESPTIRRKVLSRDLIKLKKSSKDVLTSQLIVPPPILMTTLTTIESGIETTFLKFFVDDETGASISGAKVEIRTKQNLYSANDVGDGFYTATVPTSELSSIQISASKSGWEECLNEICLGTDYLEEYNLLNSDYIILQTKHESLKTNYSILESEYSGIEEKYNSFQSNYSSLKYKYESSLTNYTILKDKNKEVIMNLTDLQNNHSELLSDYQDIQTYNTKLEKQVSNYHIYKSATYIFASSTVLLIISTIYMFKKKY